MLFDVVQEMRAQLETLVPSRVKPVEGEVGCLKQGSKAVSEGVDDKLGKLEHDALSSVLELSGTRHVSTLKEWTGKTRATVVYDSNVHKFTDECLFQMVRGRPNIAIVATTTDGDVFGG